VESAQDIGYGSLIDVTKSKEYAAQSTHVFFLIVQGFLELAARDIAFLAQKFSNPNLAGAGLILDCSF